MVVASEDFSGTDGGRSDNGADATKTPTTLELQGPRPRLSEEVDIISISHPRLSLGSGKVCFISPVAQ